MSSVWDEYIKSIPDGNNILINKVGGVYYTVIESDYIDNEYDTNPKYGKCDVNKHLIYINKDLCLAEKIRELKYQIAIAVMHEYTVFESNMLQEGDVAIFVAIYGNYINELTELYFKNKQ